VTYRMRTLVVYISRKLRKQFLLIMCVGAAIMLFIFNRIYADKVNLSAQKRKVRGAAYK